MQRSETVVGKHMPLSKPRLHALVMTGWARAVAGMGKGKFADALETSTQALDKQFAGSMPSLEMIDRALCVDDTILDDWLAERGKRLVDKDAVCDVDDASVMIARLMLWLQESSSHNAARSIPHPKLLDAEVMIRRVNQVTSSWIEAINQHRRAA